MKRFIEENDRTQGYLLPESIEENVSSDNPVRVIDAFVEELDLGQLGFAVLPEATGRPGYHPSSLLKIYIYGYLNRIQSSRRLEREAQRNLELMWLTGRLMPDFKTIANFRKDNGEAIRGVCREFVALCRRLNLFSQAIVAIDADAAGTRPASIADRSGCAADGDQRQGDRHGRLQRANGGRCPASPDRGSRGHECGQRPWAAYGDGRTGTTGNRRSRRDGGCRSRVLQWRRDSEVHERRHDALCSQAAALDGQGRWTVWQTGLHLHRAQGRISLSGGSATDATIYEHRRRDEDPHLLVLGVRVVFDQVAMHDVRCAPGKALGTRGGTRPDAGEVGSGPRQDADPTTDGRTPIRHAEGLDGGDALSDQDATKGQDGDESARAGLQPEAGDEHPHARRPDRVHADLRWKARLDQKAAH